MQAKKHIATALIVIALIGTASAATLYVSPTGTGSTCTDTVPCTLDYARENVQPGETVLLKDGDYGNVVFDGSANSGTNIGGTDWEWTAPITYKAKNEQGAVFNSIHLSKQAPLYFIFEDIRIHNDDGVIPSFPSGSNSQQGIIFVQGSSLSHVKFLNCDIEANLDGSGELRNGIFLHYDPAEYILFDGCEVHAAKMGILFYGGRHLIVRNSEVHYILSSGIQTRPNATDVLIENSHIHNQIPPIVANYPIDPHGSGLSIRSENTTIRNNTVHDYGTSWLLAFYQDEVGPPSFSNMTVENNLLYDVSGYHAMGLYGLKDNVVVRNNTVIGRYDSGPSSGGAYRYYRGVTFGFEENDGSGLSFYNNVVVGQVVFDNAEYMAKINEGNNIVWSLQDYGGGSDFHKEFSASSTSIVLSDGSMLNGYGKDYFDAEGAFFAGGPNWSSHATYKALAGLPAGYAGKWSHGENLTDAYKPAAGSPAIGFANPAHAPAADLLGNPRDSQPDAGAYEFGGITCTDGQTRQCGTTDVGECSYGTQACSAESWGTCMGAINPATEVCDNKDNDCDGQTDEGNVCCPNYAPETTANNNCFDGQDNDCDGQADSLDTGCHAGSAPTDYIAYWKFDNSLSDETGNNSGTFQGGTTAYTTGHSEQAIKLNGNNQYVDAGNNASTSIAGGLTITAWINPDSFGQGGYGRIVDKGSDAVTPATGYSLFVDGSSNRLAYVVYGGSVVNSNPNTIATGQWQHAALAYDETLQTVTFYVNGLQEGSSTYAQNPADSYAYNLVIGIRDKDKNRDFDGSIDELRIYNRALTSEEIQAVYNFAGTAECIDTTALVGYISEWKQGSLGMASLLQKISAWKAGTGCL